MEFTTSDQISLVTAGMALVALALSVFNYFDDKKNTEIDQKFLELNLKPDLSIDFVDHNDQNFHGIRFRNAGSGPANIQGVLLFTKEGKGTKATDNGWRAIFKENGIEEVPEIMTTSFDPGAIIPQGSSVRLVGVDKANLTSRLKKELGVLRENLGIGICYCSSYGKCFSSSSPGIESDMCELMNVDFNI